ncbi:MAG: hypothetical protein M1822_006223 [Bathelium mastoideum]|nr:MAG: hypothetical protein M1822_006223 [Bathelium mastoideum]
MDHVFPAGINVGATWDKDLAYARGQAMGQEMNDKGVDAQLAPVCGPLGRSPDGGRNWEGFSNDPYLCGAMIAPTVQGMQELVMATTKHYILNEQEHFRQVPEAQGYGFNITGTGSANLDDKTMHELYLWPFADAVRAGTVSIMCSYNQINNSQGCANSYTLNYLLKNELDFQGFVMSDWQASHGGVNEILAGTDMSMPGDTLFSTGYTFYGTNTTIAILNGTLPQWRLDDAVTRILAAWYYVGRDTKKIPVNFSAWTKATYGNQHALVGSPTVLVNEHVDVQRDHKDIIREVGRASAVLLKNNGVLPLKGTERQVGLFGNDAGSNPAGANGCSNRGCFNGTLAMGWGSGTADFPYLVTPEEAIQNYIVGKNSTTQTITNNYADAAIQALATQADTAIVFVGADSGEGFIVIDYNYGDRRNLTLWQDGDRLVRNVSSLNNNTILVIHSVGPVEIDEYANNPNITAILWAGLPGQESGNALVDVLYGKYNPGGKLPFTMGKKFADYGTKVLSVPNNGLTGSPQIDYTEGVFTDYRHFDAKNITPTYEFGYGLSYTTFEFSNLQVKSTGAGPYTPTTGRTTSAPTYGNYSKNPADYLFPSASFPHVPLYIYPYLNTTDLRLASADPDYGKNISLPSAAFDGTSQPLLPAGGAPGGNPGLWEAVYTVTADIANTGSVRGSEVAQVYVGLGADQPPKVLRGFERIWIDPGQTATFTANLTRRDVSTWDPVSQNWVQVEKPYVWVGSSSRKLPLGMQLE